MIDQGKTLLDQTSIASQSGSTKKQKARCSDGCRAVPGEVSMQDEGTDAGAGRVPLRKGRGEEEGIEGEEPQMALPCGQEFSR